MGGEMVLLKVILYGVACGPHVQRGTVLNLVVEGDGLLTSSLMSQ